MLGPEPMTAEVVRPEFHLTIKLPTHSLDGK